MRRIVPPLLLAGAAAVSGCATAVAPATTASVCGGTAFVDVNNDGWISGDEWNTFRTASYGFWDVNRDGRISRSEFERCYRGGGFYREAYYNPDYWTHYWSAFDANNDGWLSGDEYWSAAAWSRIDRNGNGRIDSDEWVWWGS